MTCGSEQRRANNNKNNNKCMTPTEQDIQRVIFWTWEFGALLCHLLCSPLSPTWNASISITFCSWLPPSVFQLLSFCVTCSLSQEYLFIFAKFYHVLQIISHSIFYIVRFLLGLKWNLGGSDLRQPSQVEVYLPQITIFQIGFLDSLIFSLLI